MPLFAARRASGRDPGRDVRLCRLADAGFFFSSRRRHTRYWRDCSSDVCSSDLSGPAAPVTVVGWGSLNVFNSREAYRFVADFSIYVERAWRGRGVGRAMLEALIELARTHGFHKLVLSAFPFNAGGGALYEKLGFRTVGVYREQGLLDGKWVDTIIMEKLL